MRKIERTTVFKRDFKREMRGQHGPTLDQRLTAILVPLSNDVSLPESCRDHALSGKWSGHRECHVRPDLLLIYERPDKNTLLLERLGSHHELFGK
jgi:mRNA interferase YafQ